MNAHVPTDRPHPLSHPPQALIRLVDSAVRRRFPSSVRVQDGKDGSEPVARAADRWLARWGRAQDRRWPPHPAPGDAVVRALALLECFEASSGTAHLMRDHGGGVGALAGALASEVPGSCPQTLFAAGAVHDVGKLLIHGLAVFDYGATPREMLLNPDRTHHCEREALGYDHAALGAEALRRWGMPTPIVALTALHHQPGRAYAAGAPLGSAMAVLRLANTLDHQLRRDRTPNRDFLAMLGHTADAGYLNLDSGQLARRWDALVDARDEALDILDG